MNVIRLLSVAFCLILAGCASNPMQVAKNQELSAPEKNKAHVVFMRSSFVGSAISSSVYDVSSGEPEFIGILANGTKLAYSTKPGKRVFMVVSEAADFMEADLKGGKIYYSMVTPRMGAWKARFSMWPIKTDSQAEYTLHSEEFKKWKSKTKLVENTAKSKAWFENNKTSIKEKYTKYWKVWNEKTPEELAKRSLSGDDGL